MPTYNDYPFAECSHAGRKLIAQGHTVFMKWTCRGCRKRLTSSEPNVFFANATCEECGHVTNVAAVGCNYSVQMTIGARTK